MSPTYYERLGLTPAAEPCTIRKTYYKIATINHPDTTLGMPEKEREKRAEILIAVSSVWEVLGDEKKRHAYDCTLRIMQDKYPQSIDEVISLAGCALVGVGIGVSALAMA